VGHEGANPVGVVLGANALFSISQRRRTSSSPGAAALDFRNVGDGLSVELAVSEETEPATRGGAEGSGLAILQI
jgi:hypothetical protein